MAHQTFRQHDLLPSVDLEGDIRRDPLQRHQDHLHVGAPAFCGDDIGLPVPQEGQFLVEVQNLRCQLVFDVTEHLLAHQFVHLGHLPEIHDVDAGIDELALQLFPDAVGHGALLRHLLLDMDDLLGRGPSGDGIDHVRSQLGAVGQDAYTNPIELVQVGLVDGQELQPFQQRNAGVRRLHQHPEVKFQPAHFPVHIEPVRRWFGLFIGAVLFLLVSHGYLVSLFSCPSQAFSSASTMIFRVRMRAYFLSLDSMMNQGAFFVLVLASISSMASS